MIAIVLFSAFTYSEGQIKDEIRKAHANYVEMYNKHDAKGLSQKWAEDAVYENPRTGVVVEGREAIEKQFVELFKNQPNIILEAKIDSITSPNENEAIETGRATFTLQGQPTIQTHYRVFYVKSADGWKLGKISEIEHEEAPTHFEELKPLAWLIGTWVDEDDDGTIEFVNQWDKYNNFITQHFTVNMLNSPQYEGKQIIAWDPITKQIRSWMFDSDGGYGEGKWTKKDDNWIVETTYVTPDGKKASAVNIYSDIEKDSYTWESTGRQVEGEILPNIDPVTVTKKEATTSKGEKS